MKHVAIMIAVKMKALLAKLQAMPTAEALMVAAESALAIAHLLLAIEAGAEFVEEYWNHGRKFTPKARIRLLAAIGHSVAAIACSALAYGHLT